MKIASCPIFKWLLLATVLLGTSFFSKSSCAVCDGFPPYDEISAQLQRYAIEYPQIVALLPIGETVETRTILGLRISANVQTESEEPEIRIIGGIHGDECQSVNQVMTVIDWLLVNYHADDQITHFVDNIDFVFIPLLNPDGYEAEPSRRVNATGLDLNRNFGFGWSRQNQRYPFSEPESQAFRSLSQQNAITLGITYHTTANYINAAWNYLPMHPRDEVLLNAIGTAYAGQSPYEVVFGWDWYQISGDVNDWSLGTLGTFDWTIELASATDAQFEIHEPGLRSFFSWALNGIHGTVREAQTGMPLHGMITVEPEGEPIFTDPSLGDYHRVVLPGKYEITAWAPGYHPFTIEQVVVEDAATEVDFFLERDVSFTAGFQVNQMILPRDISNTYVQLFDYENDTIVSDSLGISDGYYYSMGAGGEITIDMGAKSLVTDVEGWDFRVVSGTGSADVATVYVASLQDGPFVEAGSGHGDILVDLHHTGLKAVRYIRVVDQMTTPLYWADSGYDLDAIENLAVLPVTLVDSDSHQEAYAISGCQFAKRPASGGFWRILF